MQQRGGAGTATRAARCALRRAARVVDSMMIGDVAVLAGGWRGGGPSGANTGGFACVCWGGACGVCRKCKGGQNMCGGGAVRHAQLGAFWPLAAVLSSIMLSCVPPCARRRLAPWRAPQHTWTHMAGYRAPILLAPGANVPTAVTTPTNSTRPHGTVQSWAHSTQWQPSNCLLPSLLPRRGTGGEGQADMHRHP